MSRVLIRGGSVVTMNKKREVLECADILIDGRIIASITPMGEGPGVTGDVPGVVRGMPSTAGPVLSTGGHVPKIGDHGHNTGGHPRNTADYLGNTGVCVRDKGGYAQGAADGLPGADRRSDRRLHDVDMIIDARGKVVMPGFVQSHVHLCQTLFRGQADDLELLDWLKLRIWPLEGAHDRDSIYWSAMLGITELIKGGTTSIIDMETVHYTDSAFLAIGDSGIRATSGKVMMDYGDDVPSTLMESTEDSLNESEALMNKWHMHDGGRIRYAFAPRFVVSCTDRLLMRVHDMAKASGVIVHTHASENKTEVELVMADRGMRNVKCLHELGLLGPDVVLAHCVWLDDEEMELLKDFETKVVHCPSSNLKLASGLARIPEMLDMGVFVSLGADGAPCNNNLDAFWEMRLAALIHKPRLGPTAMPAKTVLEMATKGGAEAMGTADEVGSIEPGKRADIIILDLNQVHAAPTENVDLVSRIVYEASAADVEITIVDGRVLMYQRQLTAIDESEVVYEANKALERVLRRSGCAPPGLR